MKKIGTMLIFAISFALISAVANAEVNAEKVQLALLSYFSNTDTAFEFLAGVQSDDDSAIAFFEGYNSGYDLIGTIRFSRMDSGHWFVVGGSSNTSRNETINYKMSLREFDLD